MIRMSMYKEHDTNIKVEKIFSLHLLPGSRIGKNDIQFIFVSISEHLHNIVKSFPCISGIICFIYTHIYSKFRLPILTFSMKHGREKIKLVVGTLLL